MAAILAAASNVRRVCSTVAMSVVCSRPRLAFRSVRDGRRRGLGAAGTAPVCGRVRPGAGAQAVRAARRVGPGRQRIGGEAGPLVRGG
ncbi:hypothetical protein AB0O64_34815 [Streptomyces sp. NPDC088341]|uniref:hypothetical protein n=1 Tax=Streptomyces sp. NPDC088341 TaxID=3154870 RepID=UPI0034344800